MLRFLRSIWPKRSDASEPATSRQNGDVSDIELSRPWSVERVILELEYLGPLEQREPLKALEAESENLANALCIEIERTSGLARLNAAVLLLKLQDNTGHEPFLLALSDVNQQRAAMEFLQFDIDPFDTANEGRFARRVKVPVTGNEIFDRIEPLLKEPGTDHNRLALFICLRNDIEASRPLSRQLLQEGSPGVRFEIAQWYLRHGRDDGAIATLESFFDAAPNGDPQKKPSWYELKVSWSFVLDACRSGDPKVKADASGMAMRVLSATIDAEDFDRHIDVNDGFVSVAQATQAIALGRCEGAEALLEHIITDARFSPYDRGAAVVALGDAYGPDSHAAIVAALNDPAIREYAAKALGELARDSNNADDIAVLAEGLKLETRPESIGAILSALYAIGPAGSPHIEAALNRAPEWDRMRLAWRMDGGSNREFADLLRDAGAIDEISDEALAEAMGEDLDLVGLLWAAGERLVAVDIKADETPPLHHPLFNDLMKIARPEITVENLRQTSNDNYRREPVEGNPNLYAETDLGTVCKISFSLEGQEHSFSAFPSGRWLDAASVVEGFNTFLASSGRDDRCFVLKSNGQHMFFVVAHEQKFKALAKRFHIPLEEDHERNRREGIDYVAGVIGGNS